MKKFTVTYNDNKGISIAEDVDADYFEIDRNVVLFKQKIFNSTVAAFNNFIKVELKYE